MLPSRGLVQSSQALRLRHVTTASRAGCARNFGTAMRRRAGAPATASSVSIGRLSGRRVTAGAPRSNINLTPSPSSAAAFSLWPSSKSFKASDVLPDANAAAAGPQQTPPSQPPVPGTTAAPSEFVPDQPVQSTLASPSVSSSASSASAADASNVSASSSASSHNYTAPLPDPNSTSEFAELLDGSALLDMPSDQIGYLHALGLDFGWGPTSSCQWLLEHIHVYTGLPWWAAIMGASVLFRAAVLMPSLTAAEHSAKMQVMRKNPKYAATIKEMQTNALKGGPQAQSKVMEARVAIKRMNTAAGIQTWRMFVPMINIPFGFGMFRLLRAMAVLPVPGMETAGMLWFTDLTVPDPYFILPIASAGIMYLIFRSNMKYMSAEQQATMKLVQMVITPISIFVTVNLSAGTTFFFFTSSVLQMGQTWLWQQPWLREWKGLPPLSDLMRGSGGASPNSPPGSGGHAAAHPVSFRLDPGSSWKAPRASPTGVPEPSSSSPATSDLQLPKPPSTIEVAKKGWNKMMGTAKNKQSASYDKEAIRKAQDYEKKRAMEDETELYRRMAAEKQYRDIKKRVEMPKNGNAAAADPARTKKWQ